jgi:hypothetical protein
MWSDAYRSAFFCKNVKNESVYNMSVNLIIEARFVKVE